MNNLEHWVSQFINQPSYQNLINRFLNYPSGSLTSPSETALLYGLIKYLKPKRILEIGSFFCHTTRIMAEALQEQQINAQIITLDPYGAERIPKLLATWPSELQSHITFKPLNSMQYFMELDNDKHKHPNPENLNFDLMFIDGCHDFQYALFDMISAVKHLKPGGCMLIDNLEQQGPNHAMQTFIKWHPGWRWIEKSCHRERSDASNFGLSKNQLPLKWGVLFAPNGLQISHTTTKLSKIRLPEKTIRQIILNTQACSHPGTLHVNVNYYSVPNDFHLTGKGIDGSHVYQTISVDNATPLIIDFAPSLSSFASNDAVNVNYEIELSYVSNAAPDAFLLLNAQAPITIVH